MSRRPLPLPNIGREPIPALMNEYATALHHRQNTKAITRRLAIAVARQIRRESRNARPSTRKGV